MSFLPFSRLSFRGRLYLIAIAAAFCTALSVTANFFTVRDYENNIEHIAQGELKRLKQIAYSYGELSNTHTNLYSLLRKTGKDKSRQHISLLGRKLIQRIDKLHSYLMDDSRHEVLNKKGKPYESPFLTLADDLTNYRNAASDSIKMLSVNPALSEKYMNQATGHLNKLNSALSINITEISSHIHHELEEELDLVHSIYLPVSLLLIFVAGLMAPVILKLIRDISARFQWIETTLEDLRTGKTGIKIPTDHPDSEMNSICESLGEFRTALVNSRDSEAALSENNRLLTEESERRLLTEQELRRSLIELSQAIDTAEKSSQAKSLFLANMSHEIRTPLNAVLGMAQLLQTTELDETQKSYIDTLYIQGKHLLQILNSVLDYSQMESGKLVLKQEAFQLENLIDEIGSLFVSDQDNAEIKLIVDIDDDVEQQLNGDPLRIKQILINLLSNAYKFTQQGEVRIHIQNNPGQPGCIDQRPTQCPNTRQSAHCPRTSLYITVSDTGIGIAEHKQGYIFENFTQADESHTREYGGTGIGLAICKQLVELMDGEIGVMSKQGQGATFWFRICLAEIDCAENNKPARQ